MSTSLLKLEFTEPKRRGTGKESNPRALMNRKGVLLTAAWSIPRTAVRKRLICIQPTKPIALALRLLPAIAGNAIANLRDRQNLRHVFVIVAIAAKNFVLPGTASYKLQAGEIPPLIGGQGAAARVRIPALAE